MHVIQQLRSFDPQSGVSIEEMILLATTAEQIAAGYSSRAMEVPEWLEDKLGALEREIETRSRDALLRELKEIEAREEALKTSQERRSELALKKARIQERLSRDKAKMDKAATAKEPAGS